MYRLESCICTERRPCPGRKTGCDRTQLAILKRNVQRVVEGRPPPGKPSTDGLRGCMVVPPPPLTYREMEREGVCVCVCVTPNSLNSGSNCEDQRAQRSYNSSAKPCPRSLGLAGRPVTGTLIHSFGVEDRRQRCVCLCVRPQCVPAHSIPLPRTPYSGTNARRGTSSAP